MKYEVADGRKLNLELHLVSGDTLCVTVRPDASILDVKHAAAAILEPECKPWKLLNGENLLEDSQCVTAVAAGPWQLVLLPDRERLMRDVKAAEADGQYDEMAELMSIIAGLGRELAAEERRLLSAAFAKAVLSRLKRGWIHEMNTDLAVESEAASEQIEEQQERYDEGIQLCRHAADIAGRMLAKGCNDVEARVFYGRMLGNFHRYEAEFMDACRMDVFERGDAVSRAQKAYEDAAKAASDELPADHALRMALGLNFSVFLHDIVGDHNRACRMARALLQDAIAEQGIGWGRVQTDVVGNLADRNLLLRTLSDNLGVWESNLETRFKSIEPFFG
eukprot:TRINITY_DN27283_c0_g1_i1.p1 TRINITY_DN27283_c0_g1~~TRINITY_DN27283_c0_g1_i1.p1  ORF type:complete len:335 (+),score=72.42 TRINITY_DN27283_c0_g1_i1:48-1052(+)